jgi:hypothetical protein
VNGIASADPADPPPVDAAVLVTRAGSQANRYSIELGEAVRALVRATEAEPAIPASELMVVLGHLSTAGYGLAQGLQQLAACLGRSTEQGLYWAAGEDADWSEVTTAHLSVGAAVKSLCTASRRAEQWGELAGHAQRQLMREAHAVEVRLAAHLNERRGGVGVRPDLAPVEAVETWFADREWLTLEEAAELAGVAVTTMGNAKWRRDYGAPTAHKDAADQRRSLFRRDEVLAFRQQRRGAA